MWSYTWNISNMKLWNISCITSHSFLTGSLGPTTHKWPAPNTSGFIAQLVRASHRCCGVTASNPTEVLIISGFYRLTGLLLHFQCHTEKRFKDSLLKTMIHCAYALSSTTEAFNAELTKLRSILSRLDYLSNEFYWFCYQQFSFSKIFSEQSRMKQSWY